MGEDKRKSSFGFGTKSSSAEQSEEEDVKKEKQPKRVEKLSNGAVGFLGSDVEPDDEELETPAFLRRR